MCNLQSNFIRPEPNSHEDKKMQNKSNEIDVIEDYHKQMALKRLRILWFGVCNVPLLIHQHCLRIGDIVTQV